MSAVHSRIEAGRPLARMSGAHLHQVPRPRRSAETPAPTTARIVIATSNTVVRYGIRCILDQCSVVSVVADVPTGPQTCDAVVSTHPDLLVLDLGASAGPDAGALLQLSEVAQVVILVSRPDPALLGLAARHGVSRVLVHGEFSREEFLRAIVAASRRRAPRPVLRAVPSVPAALGPRARLSSREAEVMAFIARGLRNADIADALCLTEKTVKNHINRIFAKLHVVTRAQAIVLWLHAG